MGLIEGVEQVGKEIANEAVNAARGAWNVVMTLLPSPTDIVNAFNDGMNGKTYSPGGGN